MSQMSKWTFFTNHPHVYFLLSTLIEISVKDIARCVGISERTVLGILRDLEQSDYIKREKLGRANRYIIAANNRLRHPLESKVALKDLRKVLLVD